MQGALVAPALRLLSVHPHPDDEAIACGGVLARYAAEGCLVHVVTCTGGEEGENLAGIDLGGEDLTTHRRRELAEALRVLGVERHTSLGYRDSGMAGTGANEHPDSFHRADLDAAARRLAQVVREVRPQVVLSDDADGTYGHPDHIKAHRVTVRALQLAADSREALEGAPWRVAKRYVHTFSRERLWALHERLRAEGRPSPFGDGQPSGPGDLPFGVPREQVTTRIDVGAWRERKESAIRAHRSQIGADSFFLNLPDDLATDLYGQEEFVLAEVASERLRLPDLPEDDLFAGLRERTGPGRREGSG